MPPTDPITSQGPPKKKVSTNETGHAKNVANITPFTNAIESYGAAYNPPVPYLAIAPLRALRPPLDLVLPKVDAASSAYKVAVNQRQQPFDLMPKLASRALYAIKVVGTAKEIADATAIVKKIHGGGKKLNEEDPAIQARSRSTSQMSFDMRADNFREFTAFLAAIPAYKPNEADLKVPALNAFLATLPGLSDAVSKAGMAFAKCRQERDTLLYDPNTGAVPLCNRAKNYIKSLYGPRSKEYKRVAKIMFKNYK
jgi:hypothetical protein